MVVYLGVRGRAKEIEGVTTSKIDVACAVQNNRGSGTKGNLMNTTEGRQKSINLSFIWDTVMGFTVYKM